MAQQVFAVLVVRSVGDGNAHFVQLGRPDHQAKTVRVVQAPALGDATQQAQARVTHAAGVGFIHLKAQLEP